LGKSKNVNKKKDSDALDNVSLALDLAKRANLTQFEQAVLAFLVRIGETLDKILAEMRASNDNISK